MVFIKVFFIQIFLTASILVMLFSSCSNGHRTADDNLKDHMNDSTVGHVPIYVKRTKLVFVDEPVKSEDKTIFSSKQYIVDIEQSELEWFCSKHTGFVDFKSGVFNIEDENFSKGSFIIDMDSIFNTDIDNNLMRGTLDNILKSDELFDVKNFPEVVFSVLKVENVLGNEFRLSGNLKIKNNTKPLEFKSYVNVVGDTLKAVSEKFTIDRTEWGITNMSEKYAKSEDEFIVTDSVRFIVHIVAVVNNNK